MDAGVKEKIIELLGDLHLDVKSLGDAVDELGTLLKSAEAEEQSAVKFDAVVMELRKLHEGLDICHDCIRQKSNVLTTVVETGSTEILDNIVKKPDCH